MSTPLSLSEFLLDDVYYPETDGEPMAEGDTQRDYLIYAVESLREYFRTREDMYISGNLFIYYEEGNPKAVVAPDCFVVTGVPDRDRRIYKIWEEHKAPDFVLEITSKSTRSEDLGPKRGIYAYLGVQEYWQYDPTGDYLKPALRGYSLDGENYRDIARPHPFGTEFFLPSEVLGLDLYLREDKLRFRDSGTGTFLRTHGEAEAARREAETARHKAEKQARAEAELRRKAEARLAELEAKLRARDD